MEAADSALDQPQAPPGQQPLDNPRAPSPADMLVGSFMQSQRQQGETLAAEEREKAPAIDRAIATNRQPGPAVPRMERVGNPPQSNMQQSMQDWLFPTVALSALAGAVTRGHATAALNAFSAGVEGLKEGNLILYDQKLKEWRSANEKAIQNNQAALNEYNAVWKNRQLNIDQKMNEIQLIASKYQDRLTYEAAAQKNFTLVAQLLQKQENFTDKMNFQYEKLKEQAKANEARMEALMTRYNAQRSGVEKTVDGIVAGRQPPILTGLYGMSAQARGMLEDRGFNLAKAQQEWTAAQKQIQSLNGPQMTRYAGLATSVVNTIDEVKGLAQQMNLSGVPALNRAELAAYVQTQGNTPNGQLAARYLAAVNTLKEEFANLAQGGYAPTEAAWKLADQQINADYGVKELGASLDEVQRLINYRLQGIPNFQTMGPAGENRYRPAAGTPESQGHGSGAAATSPPGGSGWGKAEVVK